MPQISARWNGYHASWQTSIHWQGAGPAEGGAEYDKEARRCGPSSPHAALALGRRSVGLTIATEEGFGAAAVAWVEAAAAERQSISVGAARVI
jgi:hypothetical protein